MCIFSQSTLQGKKLARSLHHVRYSVDTASPCPSFKARNSFNSLHCTASDVRTAGSSPEPHLTHRHRLTRSGHKPTPGDPLYFRSSRPISASRRPLHSFREPHQPRVSASESLVPEIESSAQAGAERWPGYGETRGRRRVVSCQQLGGLVATCTERRRERCAPWFLAGARSRRGGLCERRDGWLQALGPPSSLRAGGGRGVVWINYGS